MQNIGQSGPTVSNFLLTVCSKLAPKSIYQIARLQFQKYKIFQLLRGPHLLSDNLLCIQVGIWHCDAPPHQIIIKNVKRCIYAPGLQEATVTLKLGKDLADDA